MPGKLRLVLLGLSLRRRACAPRWTLAVVAIAARFLLEASYGSDNWLHHVPWFAAVNICWYALRPPWTSDPMHVYYWVLVLHMIILGGEGHVSLFPPRVLHGFVHPGKKSQTFRLDARMHFVERLASRKKRVCWVELLLPLHSMCSDV